MSQPGTTIMSKQMVRSGKEMRLVHLHLMSRTSFLRQEGVSMELERYMMKYEWICQICHFIHSFSNIPQ